MDSRQHVAQLSERNKNRRRTTRGRKRRDKERIIGSHAERWLLRETLLSSRRILVGVYYTLDLSPSLSFSLFLWLSIFPAFVSHPRLTAVKAESLPARRTSGRHDISPGLECRCNVGELSRGKNRRRTDVNGKQLRCETSYEGGPRGDRMPLGI